MYTIEDLLAEGKQRITLGLPMISKWFTFPTYEVYLRAGPDYFYTQGPSEKPVLVPTVVVSNIAVFIEYQRKGVFKKFIENLKTVSAGYENLVLENVLNPYLYDHLVKNGFTPYKQNEGCLYIPLKTQE